MTIIVTAAFLGLYPKWTQTWTRRHKWEAPLAYVLAESRKAMQDLVPSFDKGLCGSHGPWRSHTTELLEFKSSCRGLTMEVA